MKSVPSGKTHFNLHFQQLFVEPLPVPKTGPVAPCERPFGAKVRIHPAGFHSAWRHPRDPRGPLRAGAGMELSREPPVGQPGNRTWESNIAMEPSCL